MTDRELAELWESDEDLIEESASSDFEVLLDTLGERLKALGIRSESIVDEHPSRERYLKIYLRGENFRPAFVYTPRDALMLLAADLERFRLSSALHSISDSKTGYVEGRVSEITGASPVRTARILLGRRLGPSEPFPAVDISNAPGGMTVSLGPPSDDLRAMTGRAMRGRYDMSLRVEGAAFATTAEADSVISAIADSLFFRLDLATGVTLTLGRWVDRRSRPPLVGLESQDELTEFPSRRYDREPIALYWYGRSARDMPLLQFLAFYQVLEFYFPVFSELEAIRRVSRVIKQPTFSADRQTDMVKVLSAVGSRSGRGFGEERKQLKATLKECVTEDELRSFIVESPEREKFLTTANKKLTSTRFVLNKPEADLINQAGERIYDIRCKIVHTKVDDEFQLLLPFSTEASLMGHDVALVELLARQALVVGSRRWV